MNLKRIPRTLLAICAIGLAASSGAGAEEVRVGVPLALTGQLATYAGPLLKTGIDVAVHHVNNDAVLGEGRSIAPIYDDFASDKSQAISLVNRMIVRDNVTALVGPPTSPGALAAVPVANELKTALIGIAYSDDLAKAGPWGFKPFEKSKKGMDLLSSYARKKLNVGKMAFVFDKGNDGYTSLKNAFSAAFKASGGEVLSEDAFLTTETNFSAIATKIAGEEPDGVLVSASPQTAANLIIQLRQAGISPKTRFMGSSGLTGTEFVRVGREAVEGTVICSDYFAGFDLPDNRRFVEDYKKRTGVEPDIMAATGYLAMRVVAQALKVAGPNASRQAVRDALAATKDFRSIFGKGVYGFSPDRIGSYDLVVLRIENGRLVVAE